MKYSEGEEVFAKYPSTAEYYKAKILSVKGDQYKIEFEPGTEYTVHHDDIRAGRPLRSSVRSATRGRKSPTRHSPSRRSPGRRSPGRSQSTAKRLSTRSSKLPKVSLLRLDTPNVSEENDVPAKSTNNDDNLADTLPLQSRLKEIGVAPRRSTRLLSSTQKVEQDHKMVLLTRNINRAVSLPAERKTQLEEFLPDEKERGHSVQKDHAHPLNTYGLLSKVEYEKSSKTEANLPEKWKKDVNIINQPQEWGGRFGSFFLIFLLPLSIISPLVICSKNQCGVNFEKIPMDLTRYFNLTAFAAYLGFFACIAVLSIIPFGRKIDGQYNKVGKLQYRLNGLCCAITLIVIFSGCVYKGFGISDFILDNFLHLSISGWLIGTVLSILLYIKGSRASLMNVNMYGSTKSMLYNFWQGKEVNPRVGPLDVKIVLLRTSLLGMLAINLAILFKAIEDTQSEDIEHLNIATVLATSLEIFYVLDIFIFESTILTSFEIMYEGTGYMLCVGHLLYPFLSTLTTRFIFYDKPRFNYFFGLFVLFYVIGYMLYRISNSQKDEFRRNPISPTLSYLETLPTIRGKKLIVSGLWGYVRHPNYLGDIIMHWSIAAISMSLNILPYYPAVFCTLTLAYRAQRDSERCKLRYGLAWEQYKSRVKYMILNRVY